VSTDRNHNKLKANNSIVKHIIKPILLYYFKSSRILVAAVPVIKTWKKAISLS